MTIKNKLLLASIACSITLTTQLSASDLSNQQPEEVTERAVVLWNASDNAVVLWKAPIISNIDTNEGIVAIQGRPLGDIVTDSIFSVADAVTSGLSIPASFFAKGAGKLATGIINEKLGNDDFTKTTKALAKKLFGKKVESLTEGAALVYASKFASKSEEIPDSVTGSKRTGIKVVNFIKKNTFTGGITTSATKFIANGFNSNANSLTEVGINGVCNTGAFTKKVVGKTNKFFRNTCIKLFSKNEKNISAITETE